MKTRRGGLGRVRWLILCVLLGACGSVSSKGDIWADGSVDGDSAVGGDAGADGSDGADGPEVGAGLTEVGAGLSDGATDVREDGPAVDMAVVPDAARDMASSVDAPPDAGSPETRPPLVCTAPLADCNASLADGCEASINTEARCGSCDVHCQSPTPYCATTGQVSSCVNPAVSLNDQRMEWPCRGAASSDELCTSIATGATCPDGGTSVSRTITVGGKPGATYELTLRFRGVLEPKVYAGGRGPGDHFYVGGEPVASNYNVYRLAVSSPREVYYLNYDEGAGEAHKVFTINHTKAIRVSAGATMTLDIVDSDCALVRNCRDPSATTCQPLVVAGVPPAPAAFDGQFVHIEVLAVTPI